MKQAYWSWYKCIRDNTNNKAIGIKAKIEIEIGVWDT